MLLCLNSVEALVLLLLGVTTLVGFCVLFCLYRCLRRTEATSDDNVENQNHEEALDVAEDGSQHQLQSSCSSRLCETPTTNPVVASSTPTTPTIPSTPLDEAPLNRILLRNTSYVLQVKTN